MIFNLKFLFSPQIFLLILISTSATLNTASGVIDPPNFGFSVPELLVFFPNQELASIQKIHGQGTLMSKKNLISLYRFEVIHQRYKFPLFVQVFDNKVLDFFATLPSFFLHDVIHSGIIKALGPQQQFFHSNGTSLYSWDKVKGDNQFQYSSTCTITCFPLYVTAFQNYSEKLPKDYSPLLHDFIQYKPAKVVKKVQQE